MMMGMYECKVVAGWCESTTSCHVISRTSNFVVDVRADDHCLSIDFFPVSDNPPDLATDLLQ